MERNDFPLYVFGFKRANSRFGSAGSDWRAGFASVFETAAWGAAIRDHLRERFGKDADGRPVVADDCPHLEGMYFVRNLVGHVLPRKGGKLPYLAEALASHGASLASLTRVGFQADAFAFGRTTAGLLHDTWSGVPAGPSLTSGPAAWLRDTPRWQWLPRSEWSREPQRPGRDEYDRYLAGGFVVDTFRTIDRYLDAL